MALTLILGDPHLGKSLSLGKTGIGSTINSRLHDQLQLLDWILERAIEHHVAHIIVTGDVFEDPKPPSYLIVLLISWLKKCQVHGVSVHMIMGNHDILRSGFVYTSPLDILIEAELENVHVYKDIDTIIIGTTAFTMMPFRDRKSLGASTNSEAISIMRDSLVYELSSIPSTYQKILVGHLAIDGSLPIGDEIDELMNELFCPLDMFKGYDFTIMGHIHRPQVMQKSPYIAHIGSMDTSSFGETDHKKHLMFFDGSAHGQWFMEDLPTRPLQKIVVSVPKGIEDTTAYVLEQIKEAKVPSQAIVRVEVSLASPELQSINKTTIDKFLIANGAFSVNGISESKKINLIKKDDSNTIDTKMDMKSAIKTYSQVYVENEMRDQFMELALDFCEQLSET